MLLFFGLSFFLLLGALIPVRNQNFYLLLSFFILFILSAFRDISVGTDTAHYEDFFKSIELNIEWVRAAIEPGWVFLNDLVLYFGGEYRDLIVISSFLTLLPVFIVAKKYSLNPMLTISSYYLLYFYFYSFNISRQILAVSFVLISLIFLLKKRIFIFCFLIFIASLFHTSVLLCLLLIFVDKITDNKNILIIFSIFSAFLGIWGHGYISQIVSLTGYSDYILYYEAGSVLGNSLLLILFNSFLFFILFTARKITIEVKLFFIYIVLMNVTIRIPLADRLILNFAIFQILFYPYYLHYLGKFDKKSKIIAIIFILSFLYMLFLNRFGGGEILPYSNVLF